MHPIENESNVNPDKKVQKKYTDRVLGTISMALGILTIIIGFIPCIGWLSFIPGALGVIVGVFGAVQGHREGTSYRLCIYGIILSVLGLLGFLIPNLLMNTEDRDIMDGI